MSEILKLLLLAGYESYCLKISANNTSNEISPDDKWKIDGDISSWSV